MITKTVRNLINDNKDNDVAITSDHAQTIVYSDLKEHIHNISGQLSFKGLTNTDRAAIILPNGPEMATAFLAVSSYMSAAPLNPSYTFSEYEFYLNDLKPKIVIVEKNSSNPVVEAAKKLNIEICEIKKIDGAPIGIFNLYDQQSNFKLPHEENEALVLHTSGTTSRPKVVPLTNKNIYSSAINISRTLKLTSNDHCFNIMPLFHIHGLIAILSASIGAGASVYASSGFNALKFLDKAKSENITWYSGVPTMHQAILMRAKRNLILAENLCLRFVRSSSASLPPAVFDQLRDVFKSPVIEAYGMTEATHQMTSNPMPPMKQKAGFVGKAAGPEVCIMDKNGNLLKNGLEGEVCIRGDNVTKGYENNDAANATAFTNGWFRTERILEIQKKSNIDFNLLDKITVSRVTNTSEQINSIKNICTNNFSLIVIDNITDLFSYEYNNDESIFEKNSLFMKYMHELSFYAITNKIPIVITNMIRNMGNKEVENMATAIDLFTHVKIHLFKNSSIFNGQIYSPFNKEYFSYTITELGLSDKIF
ncbi:MAG TPA: AMP-binding protein [Nitrosopumilus sp.]|nr:AMP-binding protein [Nitrosopumilus sp.]